MKKILVSLLILTTSYYCKSQDVVTGIAPDCVNCINGNGYRKFSDGLYTGDFVTRKPDGKGEYKYNNGNVYVGEFKKGFYHG